MKRYPLILLLMLSLVATSCRHHKNMADIAASELYGSPKKKKPVPVREKEKPGKPEKPVKGSRKSVVDEAHRWIGVKYRYSGEDRKGVDCSGLVMKVYEKAASVKLPRDSRSQLDYCRRIGRKDLVPADLVFFSSKAGGGRVSHVGIYIGKGKFIHASSSKGVIESSLEEDYYVRHYHSAGRVLDFDEKSSAKTPTPPKESAKPADKPVSKKKPVANPEDSVKKDDRPGDREAEEIRQAVRNAF